MQIPKTPISRSQQNSADSQHVDMLDGMLALAIKDACQTQDKALQQEARTWLWVCCPDVADELGLPLLPFYAQPAQVLEYSQKYSALSLA